MTAESDTATPPPARGRRLPAPLGDVTVGWLLTLAFLSPAASYALLVGTGTVNEYFFWRQDMPVLALMTAILIALRLAPWPSSERMALVLRPGRVTLALAGICLAVGVAGSLWLFGGYRFALDEFMADFDARIFAHGQLMAPIAPVWRPFVPALQPAYVYPVADHSFWASSYLPVNAAFRAAARLVGMTDWVNPLWSAIGVAATFAVGRRLWPDRPWMAAAAAALLATSSQLIITSMTAYAMPAHLALNMVWLWCFLRGGKLGHAAAIAIGFLASGLHQLLFHPLFAAPFVLQLWLERRWRLAGIYTLAYAAIGLFWIGYWPLDTQLAGVAPQAHPAAAGGFIAGQLQGLLHRMDLSSLGGVLSKLGLMDESLVRFVAWQNPLTVPLALAGALAAWRAKGHLRALTLGVILTVVVPLVLVPTQTHGWGYRYLHGVLGSICLLSALSWARLTDVLPAPAKAAAPSAFVAACALSLFLLAPVHAWQAWSYVRPYAEADAAIRAAPADVVVVDNGGGLWFDSGALVRNDPYLTNRPKVMLLTFLDEAGLRQLCATHSVATFDEANAVALGFDLTPLTPDPKAASLRRLMRQLNCGKPVA